MTNQKSCYWAVPELALLQAVREAAYGQTALLNGPLAALGKKAPHFLFVLRKYSSVLVLLKFEQNIKWR